MQNINFKLTKQELETLKQIEKQIGYTFRKKQLLFVAITHTSYTTYAKRTKGIPFSYERLEFLGDAVLEFIVTDIIVRRFRSKEEGKLSALRAFLVKEETLAKICKDLDIAKYVLVGQSFKDTIKSSDHVLSDIYESLVGAVYLDSGIRSAKHFVKNTLINKYDLYKILVNKLYMDSKTLLQEKVQKLFKITPVYEIKTVSKQVSKKGSQKYQAYVKIKGIAVSTAYGSTKAKAEFEAAKKALENWNNIIKKLNVKN